MIMELLHQLLVTQYTILKTEREYSGGRGLNGAMTCFTNITDTSNHGGAGAGGGNKGAGGIVLIIYLALLL